jgi:hypothetical protein
VSPSNLDERIHRSETWEAREVTVAGDELGDSVLETQGRDVGNAPATLAKPFQARSGWSRYMTDPRKLLRSVQGGRPAVASPQSSLVMTDDDRVVRRKRYPVRAAESDQRSASASR